jgi:hypothetical protein
MKNQQELASNEETRDHIDKVRKYLRIFATELLKRGEDHDRSKLEEVESPVFAIYTDHLKDMTYGSDEYKRCLSEMRVALDHHYANNRHHPEFHKSREKWCPVIGFEDYYDVSNYGRIRTKTGDVLSQYITPKGFCGVHLQFEDEHRFVTVHKFVAKAFVANHNLFSEVIHKNGVKDDNRSDNLQWVSSLDNYDVTYEESFNIEYQVKCLELNIITSTVDDMEIELKNRGYNQIKASKIWECINNDGQYNGFTFVGTKLKTKDVSYVSNMNLIDIVEMFCDWFASSQRHPDGSILKSIEINKNRFKMGDQFSSILENTANIFDKEE